MANLRKSKDGQRRSCALTISVSPSERAMFTDTAARDGVSIVEMIVRAVTAYQAVQR